MRRRASGSGSRRGAPAWLLAPVAAAAAAVLFMSQNFTTVVTGYRIQRLEERLERLRETNSRLRLERLSLAELERIERIARNRLGMVDPDTRDIVFLRLSTDGTGEAASQEVPFLASLRDRLAALGSGGLAWSAARAADEGESGGGP